jgi:UDP-galactopyranose mutase
MKKALIIGAGFTGCTTAMLLKQKGWAVTVIEKDGFIGGGCRTFFHGGHPFTCGPRHFLSPFQEAFDFLNKIVPLRQIKKVNYTFIESDETFYTYPIHENDIRNMPDFEKIEKELFSRPEESRANNFEEFWINRVGQTLYNKYIKEYNKKAWMLNSNTEMDFGFEATVKLKPLEKGEHHEFKEWFNCYPQPRDGYNHYFDVALDGCEVLLNAKISGFDLSNCTIHVDGRKLKGDIIVSSISPDTLLDYQFGELKYVGRDFHQIVLPVEFAFPKDVYFVYYPNKSEAHTRTVEYKKFTLHKSPYTLIGLEFPSQKNKLYPTMIKSEVEKAKKYLDALPDKVFSMGRMGIYRYIDIDDCILQAIEFAKKV